jgi:limonene-1,2-epoxide hydrolase
VGAAEILSVHTRCTDDEDRQDLSHHGDYFHDDIVVYQPGAEPVVGIEAYRAFMGATYAGLPDFHVVLDDQFATDDRVVCRWRISGTHSADSFGFPATGNFVEFAGVSVWEFENGKARRGWIYADIPSIMAQLGTRASGERVSPEEIVRAELSAWDRLDVEDIMSHFADDAVWEFPGGLFAGHQEIREAVKGYLARTERCDLEVVNLAIADNVVLTERVDHFLYDGKRIDARVMGTFEVTGDKITAWRDYFDTSADQAHAS